MLVRMLGNVDIEHQGREIVIPGERRSSVLATLALHPGELVSVDKIVDAVWGDAPPVTARNTIQSHIAFLRKVIGIPHAIVNRQPGYVLSLPAPATDLTVVEALIARADRATGSAERVPLFEQALACWRGSPLQGVSGSTYFRQYADVLQQLRLTTTERLLVDQLRLGQHLEVISAIAALVAQDPSRERPVQLLMTALYRSGRTSEALAAYRRLQESLRDELGLEPSPRTAAVHRRILQRDLALLVPTGHAAPARRSEVLTAPGRHQLTRLVGREAELDQVLTLLDNRRLVSVVGMGGVGKTRLALEVVRSYAAQGKGTDVVDLTAAPPSTLPSFVASALQVQQEPNQPVEYAIASVVGGGGRLLMLDNCDLLISEAAILVAVLLELAPQLRIIVTSREPLHLDGEECLLLTPLAVPELYAPDGKADSPALELLLDRARAADPAFVRDPANEVALAELCRRVEGLPLALEIIGPRLRSLTAGELAECLGERLLSWKDQRRDVSDRHRSISSLMEWTYTQLTDPEAAALDRLSYLQGGGWLTDVVALCDPDPVVGEGLILALVDRSLVIRTEVDHRTRVVLHSVIRANAQSRLAASGLAEAEGERHARWVERLIADAASRWHCADEVQLLRRRGVDYGNVRAALEWRLTHHPDRLVAMVGHLWWYWYRVGEAGEGRKWVRAALDTAGGDRLAVAMAHGAAGYLAWLVDEYVVAQDHANQALALCPVDFGVAGFAHGVLSRALGDSGKFGAAADQARWSIAAFEQAGDRWGAAWSGRCLASALLYGGNVEDAARACDRATAEFEQTGDSWGTAGALDLASRIAEARGAHGKALELALAALDQHRRCGDKSGERYTLQHLAESNWELGRLEECAEYAAQGLAISERHGFQVGALQALHLLEDVSTARGGPGPAGVWAARSARLAHLLGPAAEVSCAIARGRRQAGLLRE